jgi:hypothetical protein
MPHPLPNYYLNASRYTDPGDNASLYDDLPAAVEDVVQLVKQQLIHPADAHKYRIRPSRGARWAPARIRTVKQILLGLLVKNGGGLTPNRTTQERMVLSCDHHAILFASMMKHLGRPTRVRVGFASYLVPNRWVSHWVCETWLPEEARWMTIDPDRKIVDGPGERFRLGAGAWQGFRSGSLHTGAYYEGKRRGQSVIKRIMLHDLNAVFHNEMLHYRWLSSRAKDGPALYYKPASRLTKADHQVLDAIAAGLVHLDDQFEALLHLYRTHITEPGVLPGGNDEQHADTDESD